MRHNKLSERITRRELLGGCAMVASGLLNVRRGSAQSAKPSSLYNSAARRSVEQGLNYLKSRQNEDGSFGTGSYARNVAVCGLCGMAFLAEGSTPARGKNAATVSRVLDFILASADDSGLINVPENTDRGPMYGHGFATLFLAEAYGTAPNRPIREKLIRALSLIVKTQNEEGGWRYEARPYEADISVTVCQVMALRAGKNAGLHVPADTMDRAVEFVKRCQNPDGGFNYMLVPTRESRFPRSAAAVVALYGAGLYESDEAKRGLTYLKQQSIAAKPQAEQSYFFYGHYYAAQAMWHVGGEDWIAWYSALRERLINRQRPDGSWEDPTSPEFGAAMACLILQMPNNYLPIFQR